MKTHVALSRDVETTTLCGCMDYNKYNKNNNLLVFIAIQRTQMREFLGDFRFEPAVRRLI